MSAIDPSSASGVLSFDVVVVGGGLAGSLAALEATRTGARVAMVMKDGPGRGTRTTTAVAGGGFAAAFGHTDPADNPARHMRDTLEGGEYLNNQRLVKMMVEEAPTRIRYLEELGVEFEKDERGHYRQRQAPGHSSPRSVMLPGARMGQLGRALGQRVKESGAEILYGLTLVDIAVASGRATGIACLAANGQRVDISAGAVILATGGLGRLYPVTSNPPFMTGDGFACAYRAGARLLDMEFVQFTPAGLASPPALRGFSVNHALLARPEVRLLGEQGQPLSVPGSLAERDMAFRLNLIRLVHHQCVAEDGAAGAAWMDLRALEPEMVERLAPGLYHALQAHSLDTRTDLIEVAPEAHYFMGGIEVDLDGQTTLPGLYAVGEVASGFHGANRLTHNAFPEVITLSPRAGAAAGRAALQSEHISWRKPASLERWDWPPAPEMEERLRDLMLRAAGPVRGARAIASALGSLAPMCRELRRRKAERTESLTAGLTIRNMCLVAELVLRCALRRQESRGSHFREDFPYRNDARWLCNITVEAGWDGPLLRERPVDLAYLQPGR